MTTDKQHLVWMDLEMTGLNPESDEIIEIASLVTDGQLNIIAEGPEIVIHQPPSRFQKMDEWNRNQHTKSGLWAKVLASQVTIADAEKQTLDFLREHTAPKVTPLCGNSIWQDRRFINRYMPAIDSFLHYRMVDVSSFKEMVQRWYPKIGSVNKRESHRALDDIIESVEELKFYRDKVFK